MSWTRRTVLASAGASIIGLTGLAQRAHEDALLEASVRVSDWEFNDHGVSDLWFKMESRSNESIEPACICWAEEKQAQQPWEVVSGPRPLNANQSAEYHITVPIPSPDVHLLPNRKAILMVYDSGRDAHTKDVFKPTKGDQQ